MKKCLLNIACLACRSCVTSMNERLYIYIIIMFNVYICVGIKCVIPCEMKMNFCVWFSIIIIMCGGVGGGTATSDRPGRGAVCANGVEAAAATS